MLLTLLLHVGAAASICAWLARSAIFRKVLFTEVRDSDQKLKLMLFVTPPLAFGVILRIVGQPYRAADLMLEGSFLLGLLGGRVVGPLGGSIISLPAFLHHEWLSMPVAATAGLVGGLIRQSIPNTEEIWKLGPFTFHEHAALAGARVPRQKSDLGNAAAGRDCRAGTGSPGARPRHQAAMAFLSERRDRAGDSRWSCSPP